MSYTEFHTGKIKLIPLADGQLLDDLCKIKCEENNYILAPYNDNYFEVIQENSDDKYIIVNDNLYEIFDHYETDDESTFCKLFSNDDGSLNFVTQFYNGGTCLSEMLQDGIDDLTKDKKC